MSRILGISNTAESMAALVLTKKRILPATIKELSFTATEDAGWSISIGDVKYGISVRAMEELGKFHGLDSIFGIPTAVLFTLFDAAVALSPDRPIQLVLEEAADVHAGTGNAMIVSVKPSKAGIISDSDIFAQLLTMDAWEIKSVDVRSSVTVFYFMNKSPVNPLGFILENPVGGGSPVIKPVLHIPVERPDGVVRVPIQGGTKWGKCKVRTKFKDSTMDAVDVFAARLPVCIGTVADRVSTFYPGFLSFLAEDISMRELVAVGKIMKDKAVLNKFLSDIGLSEVSFAGYKGTVDSWNKTSKELMTAAINGRIDESFSRISVLQAVYGVIPLWSVHNAENFGKLFTKFCVAAFAKASDDDKADRIPDERLEESDAN